MDYRIRALMGLQGLELVTVVEHYPNVFLYVIPRRKTANCPTCSYRSAKVHELRPLQIIQHYRVGRKQTYLVTGKRRFFCTYCHKPFSETVPGVKPWGRKTEGVDEDIVELLKEASFAGVKRRLGVAYRAQVQLLKQVMKPFTANWQWEEKHQGKFALGIDEHSFSGHDMVMTITNLTAPRLVSILPDDRQTTLNQFLSQLPVLVKEKIGAVAIDMCQSYRSSIHQCLPQAAIVLDQFHVIADANKRIDEERRILQNVFSWNIPKKLFLKNKEHLKTEELKVLQSWFAKLPDLHFYWHVKETLRSVYHLSSQQEAREKLTTLIKSMWAEKDRGLSQWASTLESWSQEILNFFEWRITNAYTEGIHTKCKLIKRLGFGFRNKEVYIRKVALACLPLTFLPHFLH